MKNALAARLGCLYRRIEESERSVGRAAGSVRLVAVSKTFPAEAIAAAYGLGLRHFGENYLQEALGKQAQLAHYDISWHFIGPIQSNKTRMIATRFQWIHSLDRLKIAERLSEQRPVGMPALNVLLQVNISREASKSGVMPEALPELVHAVRELPGLWLRGLMAVPAATEDPREQHRAFAALHALFQEFRAAGWDQLSMGMSGDLEAAIMEGATLVRVGTALFGSRV